MRITTQTDGTGMIQLLLESFSAGYWILPQVTVVTYSGNDAIIQDDVFYQLVSETGSSSVVGSTGGGHFSLSPVRSVPDDCVAVPEDNQYAASDGDALLIAKQNGRGVFCCG